MARQPEAEVPEKRAGMQITQVLTELKGGMDWFCWAKKKAWLGPDTQFRVRQQFGWYCEGIGRV